MSPLRTPQIIALLLLLAPTTAHALLMVGPEIISFSVNPTNTDIVFIKVEDGAHEALNFTALSTNAGNAFSLTTTIESPLWQTNVAVGQRRYTLGDGSLLRSDDGGVTWTNTQARRFLREQIDATIRKEQAEWEKGTRSWVPFRSEAWTPVFVLFSVFHAVGIFASLKNSRGWLDATASAVQSAALLLIAWVMLTASYYVFHSFNDGQWPSRFWNTSALFVPNLKTAIIVNIAAKPLPLLAYLVLLSLVLPATIDAILHRAVTPPIRLRIQPTLSLTAAVVILLTHVYFAFIGYFTQ
jgi:hypothetical protein